MVGHLAVAVPGVLGTVCLLVVCAVYWRRQSLRLEGALLSLCGLALLGLSYWQADAQDRAVPDLARRLDAIAVALGRLEAQVAQVIQRQAELAVAGASDPGQGQETFRANSAQAVQQQAVEQDNDAPAPPILEIEVQGRGLSDADLAAIVAWMERIKAEHRASRISIEPVMPLESADPGGERAQLMNEAGRVIDHVFAAIGQRVDISSLVAEDVPGPRLRLGLSDA
jgi:hypothetical protein